MCTAVTYRTKDTYFGRTLDHTCSYGEAVVAVPRNMPIPLRHVPGLQRHHAIIGMAHMEAGFPLYYDAVNEKGLGMAGLNFVGYAAYGDRVSGKDNLAHFELIPWILGQCSSVREARVLLDRLNLTREAFSETLEPAQLHWIIADRQEAVTVESLPQGLRVWDNPVGVLTNNPPFEDQMLHLSNFMQLSAEEPRNLFSEKLHLKPYSLGMGAMGLPGDYSSQSRFVRAAFVKLNSRSGEGEMESVSQYFHILASVAQPRGCTRTAEGTYETTLYSSCCNLDRGIYYYTTYDYRRISAVDLHRCDPEGTTARVYPLNTEERINWHGENRIGS